MGTVGQRLWDGLKKDDVTCLDRNCDPNGWFPVPVDDPAQQHRPLLMHVAAYLGAVKCFHRLIEMGAKMRSTDDKRKSVAEFASCGNLAIVQTLLRLRIEFTEQCLILAVEADKLEIMTELMIAGIGRRIGLL